jgi:selenocysteine lyase/cysteine desulfurase
MLFHNGIGGKRKEARLRYLSRYWMNRLKDVPRIGFNTSFEIHISHVQLRTFKVEGVEPTAIGSYLFGKHHIFTTANRS